MAAFFLFTTPVLALALDQYVTWVDAVNFRETPGMDGKVLSTLIEGAGLTYLDSNTVFSTKLTLRGRDFNLPWGLFRTEDGKTGWVFMGAVKKKDYLMVTEDNTALYSAPGTNKPDAVAMKYDVCRFLGRTSNGPGGSNWLFVGCADGSGSWWIDGSKTLNLLPPETGMVVFQHGLAFLPDGSYAGVTDVKTNKAGLISATLVEKALLGTPLGKLMFKNGGITFYKSGKIFGGSIDGPQTVDTPAGSLNLSEVTFYESGTVLDFSLSPPVPVDTPAGKVIAGGIEYYESGKMRQVAFEPVEITTPAGKFLLNDLHFFESGAIKCAFFKNEQQINTPAGRLTAKGVSFYLDGKISAIFSDYNLFHPFQINTPAGPIKADCVGFFENGKIKYCKLAEDAKVGGRAFSAYDTVGFDEKGVAIGLMRWDDKREDWVPAK